MIRLSIAELRPAAQGNWHDILTTLGMPAECLNSENKPCPACGGTDRFSFTDSKGSGSFVCRSIERQGGDGFGLVMHWMNCDFRAALKEVARALGCVAGTPTRGTSRNNAITPPRRDDGDALRKLWRAALPVRPDDPVGRYLAQRGILLNSFPPVIRCHMSLPYWHKSRGEVCRLGTYPAMLTAVQGKDGRTVALHRTYLDPHGKKAAPLDPDTGEALSTKKIKTRADRVMLGSAVRLFSPLDGRLALTEGIESALAVHVVSGLPAWACVSAIGLQAVSLPPEIEEVYITGDNDESGTGQHAAEVLAKRLQREGRHVEVLTPSTPGMDWLDVLNADSEQMI